MPERTTDEALVARAGRGEEAAFLALYERHRDAIYRFAYRLLGSTALAEEIAHDCFLDLLSRPGAFDPARASLRTYLYAAARNLALKHFRHVELTLAESGAAECASTAREPLAELLAAELAEAVRRAVVSLPPLQREALVLFEYEELSLAEVAAVVGADVGQVKARLKRARANLRARLAPYLAGTRELERR